MILRCTRFFLVCVTIAVAHLFVSTAVQSRSQQPYELVRSLSDLQSKVARGDQKSFRIQNKIVAKTGRKMMAVGLPIWKNSHRNCHAAVKFVLIGGNPEILEKLLQKQLTTASCLDVLVPALAYARGQASEARRLFESVSPRSLPRSLGGHVALIKALVNRSATSDVQLAFLEDARLLSPGTLVEEAALRRAIPLVSASSDFSQFKRLVSRYVRQFGQSVYSPVLLAHISTVIARRNLARVREQASHLRVILAPLSKPQKIKLFLAISQTGLLHGQLETVEWAIENVSSLVRPESSDGQRLKIYRGALSILGKEFNIGTKSLESVEVTRLEKIDAMLVAATIRLAAAVRKPEAELLTASNNSNERFNNSASLENNTQIQRSDDNTHSDVAKQSLQAIGDVDKILKELR